MISGREGLTDSIRRTLRISPSDHRKRDRGLSAKRNAAANIASLGDEHLTRSAWREPEDVGLAISIIATVAVIAIILIRCIAPTEDGAPHRHV
jgi:hypothetical protein